MKKDSQPSYVSTIQAAAIVGWSPGTIYKAVRKGKLRCKMELYGLRKRVLIDVKSLNELKEQIMKD